MMFEASSEVAIVISKDEHFLSVGSTHPTDEYEKLPSCIYRKDDGRALNVIVYGAVSECEEENVRQSRNLWIGEAFLNIGLKLEMDTVRNVGEYADYFVVGCAADGSRAPLCQEAIETMGIMFDKMRACIDEDGRWDPSSDSCAAAKAEIEALYDELVRVVGLRPEKNRKRACVRTNVERACKRSKK